MNRLKPRVRKFFAHLFVILFYAYAVDIDVGDHEFLWDAVLRRNLGARIYITSTKPTPILYLNRDKITELSPYFESRAVPEPRL
jgi:hypothetical protein